MLPWLSKYRIAIFLAALVLAILAWRLTNSSQTSQSAEKHSPEITTPVQKGDGMKILARALSEAAATTFGTVKISGRVTDRESNKAVPQAEVFFSGPSGESSVSCDEEGMYSLELLPGFYRSYARAEGHVAVAYSNLQRLPGPVSAAEILAPREGIAPLVGVFRNQSNVNLSLSAAARIYGHVRDIDGYAISGAVVAAHSSSGHRVISGTDVAESDGSGYYELIVSLGTTELEANHKNYADISLDSTARTFFDTAGDEKQLDLVLVQGCIIEGEVVDSRGNPITEGAFEIQVSDKRYLPVGEIHNGHVRYATTRTESVRLRAWPWKSPPTETLAFQCEGGARFLHQSFVVSDAEPSLTGNIVDLEGAPLPFAFVDLFSLLPGGATQQERADREGEFAFYDLPDGPYQLSVFLPAKGLGLMLIESPSSGISMKLAGTGSIVGQLESGGDGTFTMSYQCTMRFDEQQLAITDSVSMPEQSLLVPVQNGRFRVDQLPACPLHGTIEMDGTRRNFRVDVKANTDTLLSL